MTTDKHIDIAGYLHLGLGALVMLAGLIVMLIMGGVGILSQDAAAFVASLGVGVGIGVLLLIIGLPSMIAGFGLVRRRSWARTLALVISVVNLFNFPFGTALGVYTFWVLLKDESRTQFA